MTKRSGKEQAAKVLSDLVPDNPQLEGERTEKQAIIGLVIHVLNWVFLPSSQGEDNERREFAVIQFETSEGLKTTACGSPQVMDKLRAIERAIPAAADRQFDAVMDRRKTKNNRFTFILRDPEPKDKRA